MGCGASRVVEAIDEGQHNSPATPERNKQPEELTSIRSSSPDPASKPVDAPSTAPVIQQNGTEPSAPPLKDHPLPESTFEQTSAHSGNECIRSIKAAFRPWRRDAAPPLTPLLGLTYLAALCM